jgi:hypothetical protein
MNGSEVVKITAGMAAEALARARGDWTRTRLPARLIHPDRGWHCSIHGYRCLVSDVERFTDSTRDAGYSVRITGVDVQTGREHAANFGPSTTTTIWTPPC